MKAGRRENELDVNKILRDFAHDERSEIHRKGTFKIDAPFERALEKIVKVKTKSHPSKIHR